MKLTKEEVQHIAKLANLALIEPQILQFQKQLSEVLSYVELLQKADTSLVKPTSQITNLEGVSREDKVEPGLTQEETLSSAKEKMDGMFKVKTVLGK